MKEDFVAELSGKEFATFIKKGIVLVDFYADWCTPCIMMTPIIEELAKKYNGKINFGKINIDGESDVAQKYGIRHIPNFVLFKDGQKIEQFVGSIPAEDFEEKLKGYL